MPKSVERSTYVLLASLALVLLFWQWRADAGGGLADRPIRPPPTRCMALSFVGWLLVLASTFMINHFELFGLHQVFNNLSGRLTCRRCAFKTPMLYNFVRHPIYLGFIIAFWAAPTMTVGHLLFAAVTTAYIFVGIFLEEHDLVEMFGDEYRRYKQACRCSSRGANRPEPARVRCTAPALCRRRLRSANLPRMAMQAETSAPARRDPKAIEAAIARARRAVRQPRS